MHTKNLLQNLPQPKGTLESNTSQVGNVCKKNCPSCGRLGPEGRWEGQWVGGLTYLHLFFKCSSHDTNLVPITKTQDKYMNLQWSDPQLTIDSHFL
jgi:hypothetical protein